MKGNSKLYESYNSAQSQSIRIVTSEKILDTTEKHGQIPIKAEPNSVIVHIINESLVSERYYDENGDAYLDIDYTNHGNSVTHPVVPHQHRWVKDKNGKLKRGKWERIENDKK